MIEDMPRRRRLFERKEITRHGKTVWYFRRPGETRVRLPDDYGSPAYLEAYERALAGKPVATAGAPQKGTLAWLVSRYKRSGHFAALAPSSRTTRDYIMEAVCRQNGHIQFAKIARKHVIEGMDRRKPHAARNFLTAMSVLFKWAVDNELLSSNPCDGIEPRRAKIVGHHAWTLDEVEKFRAAHAVGTRARLALDLLLFTGLRRSDVIRIGRQHVQNSVLTLRTEKTGTALTIPVFSELAASIRAAPTGTLVFLTNAKGEPFTSGEAFYGWFARQVKAAGLPSRCTPHGLRKAGATIAADNGATVHELMAMFGWSRTAMAETYTKAADRARLARSAAERIANNARPHLDTEPGSSAESGTKISG